MLKPYHPALMEAYAVNSVKNDTEECIEPAPCGGITDNDADVMRCLLMTQSGHWQCFIANLGVGCPRAP